MFKRLIGNKVTEKDLRKWLNSHGYFGSSAEIQELELHAIQRPGWLQIFRFSIRVKHEQDGWQQMFGVLRDDERYRRLDIEMFDSLEQRQVVLDEWSQGLIVKRTRSKKK